MECKLDKEVREKARREGINRYIVECKYWLRSYGYHNGHRINRYIVECKFFEGVNGNSGIEELIDT